ncbi:MAG: YciI family protein, partial [Jatrophihabitantaceae bacterium]
MRYLIMIHSNPASRARWETLSDEQRMAFGRAHYALHDALLDSGDLVSSEGLPDPGTATHVSVRDGKVVTTDGPFAEVKEYLAGFYLVDVASLPDAVAIAARVPDAEFGHVEVRPV